MKKARYRRWTQPSLPLRPSTADPAQGPQTAIWEVKHLPASDRRSTQTVLVQSRVFSEDVVCHYRPRFRFAEEPRSSPSSDADPRPTRLLDDYILWTKPLRGIR